MKKVAFYFILIFSLSWGMSCSNDDQKDEKMIMQVNVTEDSIVDFFKTELPERHNSSEIYHKTESFFYEHDLFGGHPIEKDIVNIINNQKEISEIYLGKKVLPKIDFDKFTLIIGQAIMPTLGFYVAKKELKESKDGITLNVYAINDSKSDEIRPTALQSLYYWAIYPKLSQKFVKVNIISE